MGQGRRRENLTGQKFNRITFIDFVEMQNGHAIWKVKCDCGVIFNTYASSVKYGSTKSCGCLKAENCKKLFSKDNGTETN